MIHKSGGLVVRGRRMETIVPHFRNAIGTDTMMMAMHNHRGQNIAAPGQYTARSDRQGYSIIVTVKSGCEIPSHAYGMESLHAQLSPSH